MLAIHTNENKSDEVQSEFFSEHSQNSKLLSIQPKLSVGAVDDPFEREADAMADRVMRTPETTFLQRKCAACEHEEEEQIQRKITPFIQKQGNGSEGGLASESVTNQINSSRGGGNRMSENTLSFMESRFNSDFSGVKIHTDSNAVQMSRELNAQAFTVGSDIYFNEGKYSPESSSGKHLLAHELTHTVQQGGIDREIQRMCGDVAQNWYNPIIRVSSFDSSCLIQYTNIDVNSIQNVVTPWSRNALNTGLFGAFAGMATTILGRRLGLSPMAALVFGGIAGGARSYVGMTVKERIRGNTVNTHNWYGSYKYDAYNNVVLATNFHGIGPNTISLVAPWYYEEALFDADNNIIANYIHTNEMDLPGISISNHIPLPEYSFGTF